MFNNIEKILYDNREEKNAVYMSKYMRSKFEFLGIRAPEKVRLEKIIFNGFVDMKNITEEFVYACFEKNYREFQYIAIDYLIRMKKHFNYGHIELLKKIILIKSWWDTVDIIASNLVGSICGKYPTLIEEILKTWINHPSIWIRRSSIIFQLRYKEKTNTEILEKSIKENIYYDDFFVQKAIGWALREYSKTNPKWVLNFIDDNKLSNLSKREAKKYLLKCKDFVEK